MLGSLLYIIFVICNVPSSPITITFFSILLELESYSVGMLKESFVCSFFDVTFDLSSSLILT